MFCQGQTFKHTLALILIVLSIIACMHSPPPRVDTDGNPQREYIYQKPEIFNDGWQVSSMAKEGVNEEIILDLIQSILDIQLHSIYRIYIISTLMENKNDHSNDSSNRS